MKDLWSYVFKDKEKIDWESKGELENASRIVFNESCRECHVNLYPEGISDDGVTAHLYYDDNEEKLGLECISCHLDAGHYNPGYSHTALKKAPQQSGERYSAAAVVDAFEDFTETVPGTAAAIRMIAVPGGEFTMGSPEDEKFRKDDEVPCRRVGISPFFMGET